MAARSIARATPRRRDRSNRDRLVSTRRTRAGERPRNETRSLSSVGCPSTPRTAPSRREAASPTTRVETLKSTTPGRAPRSRTRRGGGLRRRAPTVCSTRREADGSGGEAREISEHLKIYLLNLCDPRDLRRHQLAGGNFRRRARARRRLRATRDAMKQLNVLQSRLRALRRAMERRAGRPPPIARVVARLRHR